MYQNLLPFDSAPSLDLHGLKPVVSFSGGRTSAFLSARMLEMFGGEVDFIYMDTGAEHPRTYDFIRRCDQHFGLNLVCLRGDFDQPLGQAHGYNVSTSADIGPDHAPFTDMMRKYGTPTVNGAWCTSRMKQEIHDKYCDDVYGKGRYSTWIGIRADEPRRLRRLGETPEIRFLAEISDASKEDVLEWWSRQPFDLELPEHLGNCVFCVKKSIAKLTRATQDEPELLETFKACVAQANPRPEQGRDMEIMYRGRNSLDSLRELGEVANHEYLQRMTQGSKACEESCEVFDLGVDESA